MLENPALNLETNTSKTAEQKGASASINLSDARIEASLEDKLLAKNIKDRDTQIRLLSRKEQFQFILSAKYLETIFSVIHVVGKPLNQEESKILIGLLELKEKEKINPIKDFFKKMIRGETTELSWSSLRPTINSLPRLAILERYQLARSDDQVYNQPHDFYERIFGSKAITPYLMACAIVVQVIESLRGIADARAPLLRFALISDAFQGHSVGDARMISRALESSLPEKIEAEDFSYVKGYSKVKIGKFRRSRTVQHRGWGSKINFIEGTEITTNIDGLDRSESKRLKKLLEKYKDGVRS